MPENQPNQGTEAGSSRSMGERVGWAALLLGASQFLSRILGFLRESAIAYLHGATRATDAYYAAFTIPDFMSYFLAGGTFSITFVPLFSSYITDGDEEGGWRLFSNIATTMGCLLVVFVVVLEILAPEIIPWINPGFRGNERQLEQAVWMTRIVIPAQLAFVLAGLIQATLYVREVFWPAAVAPLIYNLFIITGGIALEPWFGIAGFSVGALIGAFVGPLGLALWAARGDIRYRPLVRPLQPGFRRFAALTVPLMVGVSLLRVDKWILRYFGSHIEGAITWLNDSRKLMLVVFAIVGQAAGQAVLPYLSRLYDQGEEREMGELLAANLRRVGFLAVVGTTGLVVAADPLVFAVFERGAFTPDDALRTSQLLVFFAFGLVAWTLQSVAVRGFYARENTLVPMAIGTAVVVASLPIYAGLYRSYDADGLAAATSIGITMNAVATLGVYRYWTGELPFIPILKGLGRGLLFALFCGLGGWAVRLATRRLWPLSLKADLQALLLGTLMGLGFLAGGALLAAIYRPPELRNALARIADRLPFDG